MNDTQAKQDLIENRTFGGHGLVSPSIQSQHEPSSNCCGTPYIKTDADVFRCLGCHLRYSGRALRNAGVDTTLIG